MKRSVHLEKIQNLLISPYITVSWHVIIFVITMFSFRLIFFTHLVWGYLVLIGGLHKLDYTLNLLTPFYIFAIHNSILWHDSIFATTFFSCLFFFAHLVGRWYFVLKGSEDSWTRHPRQNPQSWFDNEKYSKIILFSSQSFFIRWLIKLMCARVNRTRWFDLFNALNYNYRNYKRWTKWHLLKVGKHSCA